MRIIEVREKRTSNKYARIKEFNRHPQCSRSLESKITDQRARLEGAADCELMKAETFVSSTDWPR